CTTTSSCILRRPPFSTLFPYTTLFRSINHFNQVSLAASLLFFTLGKLSFSIKFIHKEDFNVVRLIPFSILLFAYIFLLVGFVYQDLNVFFSAAIFSFFFTLVIFQFAFLRKGVYSSRSY